LFLVFFFLQGVSLHKGYAGLSQEWLGEYWMVLGIYLFGLLNVSQASLEPVSGSGATLLFSL
jgi:hypothetical protein